VRGHNLYCLRAYGPPLEFAGVFKAEVHRPRPEKLAPRSLFLSIEKITGSRSELLSMDWKIFATVFSSVFVAELGDKTQLATLLFASEKEINKWTVFAGASLALVVTSAIGVIAGSAVSHYVSEKTLHYIAGIGFIAIGIWTLFKA
jgi:putative Ca2+/H+ antiporter (TMEM165/GDT1 family)